MAWSVAASTGGAGAGNPANITMLEVQIQRVRNPVARLFNQSDFARVSLIQNVAGVRTLLDTKVFDTTAYGGWFSTVQALEVYDAYDGATAALNLIKIMVNSVEAVTLSPVHSNIANTSGLDFAGAFTARTGLLFNGNSDGTGKPCRSYGGRLVDPPGSGFQAPSVGRPDIVIFGYDPVTPVVVSGVKDEDTLLTIATQGSHDNSGLETGQAGLFGPYVQAITRIISFEDETTPTPVVQTRRRVLCTDGLDADLHSCGVYDSIDKRFYEWDITKGGAATDLLGFQLVANHGPGVIIAAPASNRSLWALSATADRSGVYYWQNFNPSDAALAEANRAVVGTAAGYGLPADEILALVEVPNDDSDYETLFGCSRTIWSLRGNPRNGGGLSLVSSSTGFVGANAHCFDNKGNLYWLGNGGLHAMPKGTRIYTKRDGARLPEYFELADVALRECFLRFRASDNTILIYHTPRIGSAVEDEPALIACYDIEAKEFIPDEMPPEFGPSAAIEITGRGPADRDIILVGNDGFVRQYSDSSFSDDGQPIDWVVGFAPHEEMQGDQTAMAQCLAIEAAGGSGPIDAYWFTGRSADEAVRKRLGEYVNGSLVNQDTPDATARVFTSGGGRTAPLLIRKAAGAHYLVLRQFSADTTIAVERVRASFEPVGERRDCE